MTTDITELAQSEINDALAQLKQISEYPTPSTQYARVLRKYILALVEALEKAQVKNALVSGGTEATAKLHERITELESEVEKWKQESESWERVAEKQLATAIELESRTVKLPEPFKLAKSSSGLTYYYADEVDAALTAAGIKVEVE